jgi:dihydroorotase
MSTILIKNGQIINRGKIETKDILIKNGFIERLDNQIVTKEKVLEMDATGKHIFPGIIDDQVHFREPGLTHKGSIFTESRAAVAGGTTSFMEMPNVSPPSVSQALLSEKYAIGAQNALANYSFYMGATNDNLEEVLKTDNKNVCGIKVFMGSSTGNMLVDNEQTLENLFSKCPMLIATHCEDEATVRQNTEFYKNSGKTIDATFHPIIRNHEACLISSSMAVALAKKHDTRLHILHISTADEIALFDNTIPLTKKRITAEVCVHHLYFNEKQYLTLGNKIKCNPAIKSAKDQKALFTALLDNHFDVIATDHAPHTFEEKSKPYFDAPSGLPLVQHSLNIMLGFYHKGMISLERIAEKMSHAVADCFHIEKRGYIDEGYWADLVIVDVDKKGQVSKKNIHYKCAWSPLEGKILRGGIESTIVSGHLAYHKGVFNGEVMGKRLQFKIV